MNSMSTDNKDINEILPKIEKRILQLFGSCVQKIILFGSYARKDFNEESDVDIIVIVTDTDIEKYRKLRTKIISEFLIKYDILLSIRILNNEEFSKYKDVSPFLQNIVKEGILFYGWKKNFFSKIQIWKSSWES